MITNPYGQGDWAGNGNGNGNGNNQGQPQLFGALPYSPPNPRPNIVSFVFTFDQDILNSMVLGPNGQHYYDITTDYRRPSAESTAVHNFKTRSTARIDWGGHVVVDWPHIVSRQRSADWLRLAPDQMSRRTSVSGALFDWAPMGNSICLFTAQSRDEADMRVRVTRNAKNSVILEITTQAVRQGLLDPAILATVLLQSGRAIE